MTSDVSGPSWAYAYQGMDRVAKVQGGAWTYTVRDEASRIATEFTGTTVSRDN